MSELKKIVGTVITVGLLESNTNVVNISKSFGVELDKLIDELEAVTESFELGTALKIYVLIYYDASFKVKISGINSKYRLNRRKSRNTGKSYPFNIGDTIKVIYISDNEENSFTGVVTSIRRYGRKGISSFTLVKRNSGIDVEHKIFYLESIKKIEVVLKNESMKTSRRHSLIRRNFKLKNEEI